MKTEALNYLENFNGIRKLFKQNPLSIDNPQELHDFCECQLSPENLHCDGELDRKSVKKKKEILEYIKELAQEKIEQK